MFGFIKFFLRFYNRFFSADKQFAKRLHSLIGFTPANIAIFKLAFYHKSASAEKLYAVQSNERLEYLGDAVLGTIVAEYLFKKYPNKDEGFLTKMRSKIVKRQSLNKIADKMGLDVFLNQYNNTRLSRSMLGNALEALVGAVYMECGYAKTQRYVIQKILRGYLDIHELESFDDNYKSQLLEWCQKNGQTVSYKMLAKYKFEKRDRFKVAVLIDGKKLAAADDFNKKSAEQTASEKAMQILGLLEERDGDDESNDDNDTDQTRNSSRSRHSNEQRSSSKGPKKVSNKINRVEEETENEVDEDDEDDSENDWSDLDIENFDKKQEDRSSRGNDQSRSQNRSTNRPSNRNNNRRKTVAPKDSTSQRPEAKETSERAEQQQPNHKPKPQPLQKPVKAEDSDPRDEVDSTKKELQKQPDRGPRIVKKIAEVLPTTEENATDAAQLEDKKEPENTASDTPRPNNRRNNNARRNQNRRNQRNRRQSNKDEEGTEEIDVPVDLDEGVLVTKKEIASEENPVSEDTSGKE